jgi:endonuclease/exonuclease/phosphatase family metal-dependent hydrolase
MDNPSRTYRQPLVSAVRLALRHPRETVVLLLIISVVVFGAYGAWRATRHSAPPIGNAGEPATLFLCAWNAENFYDDRDDANIRDDMEDWFGSDSAAFRAKVDHLAEGLLMMNGGVGPDIACLCEVENERCLEALKDAFNAKLEAAGHGNRKWTHIVFKGDASGRYFAPSILTRMDVVADRTRKLGTRFNGRILEGHLHHNGHELIVIAAHWTSRVTDDADDGRRRLSYANDCYGRVKAILKENPDADVIVCGDLNDEFKDVSLRDGLRAVDNADMVRASRGDPRLLALFAGWNDDPPGTIRHGRTWHVFDHICLSRGLLDDRGWSCDVATARVFAPASLRRKFRDGAFEPFKFGNKSWNGERGYSDHFAVTAQLSVGPADRR